MRAASFRSHRLRWLPPALLVALVAVGCEREPTAVPEVPEGGAARLEVTPQAVQLGPRDSVEFTAVAYTESGQVAAVKVTWHATGGVMAGARQSGGRHYGWLKNGKCGENTVTATAHPGNQSGTAVATVVCPTDGGVSASRSTVSAAPATITTSSGSSVATVTVTALDASGNPVSGAMVVLSVTGSGTNLTQPSSPTDAGGVASGSLSSTASGVKTVSATIDGVDINQTATVTVSPGPPSASQSTLSANPTSIAVGSGTSTITVTVKDTFGNPVSGSTVTLAVTGSGNTLTQPSGPTNANGVATGTLSSTVAEAKTVSATAAGVSIDQTATVQVTDQAPPPPPGNGVVLVGAGDIAGSGDGDEATAQLLDGVVAANPSAVVFTAGDNAYPDGTASNFADYYEPTWGRHRARTRPSPGNHDYHTSGASAYYAYFGSLAGPSGRGYYSYDLGDWHIISLNSNVDMNAGSTQEQWLRADLAATTKDCVLAYWHHPRFSSSSNHGSSTRPQPLYQALYDHNAEVIVAGHDHTYERFAPQDANGTADPSRGIRQFVVGTGGRSLYGFGSPEPNSEVRYNSTFGVIKFTLSTGGYAWEYMPVSDSFSDTGSGSCH